MYIFDGGTAYNLELIKQIEALKDGKTVLFFSGEDKERIMLNWDFWEHIKPQMYPIIPANPGFEEISFCWNGLDDDPPG